MLYWFCMHRINRLQHNSGCIEIRDISIRKLNLLISHAVVSTTCIFVVVVLFFARFYRTILQRICHTAGRVINGTAMFRHIHAHGQNEWNAPNGIARMTTNTDTMEMLPMGPGRAWFGQHLMHSLSRSIGSTWKSISMHTHHVVGLIFIIFISTQTVDAKGKQTIFKFLVNWLEF